MKNKRLYLTIAAILAGSVSTAAMADTAIYGAIGKTHSKFNSASGMANGTSSKGNDFSVGGKTSTDVYNPSAKETGNSTLGQGGNPNSGNNLNAGGKKGHDVYSP